jgi:hypothetical protein
MGERPDKGAYPRFDRASRVPDDDLTVIGGGELGGKAFGLASIKRILEAACPAGRFPGVAVGIPRMTVLGTAVFEQFIGQNDLDEVALADLPNERIAHAFLKAEMPVPIVGDLRALISGIHAPLAIRSSSLLEDALRHPFAGVYATKMIPNDQASIDDRFKKLSEAIKFVWASTYFQEAKSYLRMINHPPEAERMAVIIQEVVGERYGERYYPIVSGVVRTHNFYPIGPARAEDGVASLALGLGKTIVDGGVTWTYCPRYPRHGPPFASTQDMLRNSQTRFWAVSMAPAPYDPVNEAEHLVQSGLDVAEWDDVLGFTASTYNAESDRLTMGVGGDGPRVLNFARILDLGDVPLNDILRHLGRHCKDELRGDVEIEFALTLDRRNGLPARFGFLQIRPMRVADDPVTVDDAQMHGPRVLVASETVLGNGEDGSIADVVYVKPRGFDAKDTLKIAAEVEAVNRGLALENRPYVLIGFGRWGSSDPWLGIPVTWPQISTARVIVEATRPEMDVEASQGSHFFHNMISFNVRYFTVRHAGEYQIDWAWLDGRAAASETERLRHVRLEKPLDIRVDGRNGRGVILHY